MYSYTDVKKLILDSFSPLIAVESSQSAEKTCREAGVSAIQLLRPFTEEKNINYTFPFESRSVQVKDINFKLEYTSFIKHMDNDEIEVELLDTIDSQKPQNELLYSMISQLGEKGAAFSMDQPWIKNYLSTLIDCCRYGESDLLDHPLAVILVVSSDDPDPIHRFDELSQRALSRKCYTQKLYSPSIPFFYFLIHSADSPANVEEIFYGMKSSFNASQCKVLRINSLPPERKLTSSPFAEHFSLSRSACLRCSDEDIKSIQDAMHSILARGVLQNLVKLITSYTQDIVNDRRGIANTLFGWFKTSSSSNLLNSAGSEEPNTLYHPHSIEFKIRFIADMAFLLEDYDTAIEYYKMIIDDYRINKSFFEIGEVSQMISLSFFLLGGKPSSGGIQIRDVYFYTQQACSFFKMATQSYTPHHSVLAAVLGVTMLRCQEIIRKSRVFSYTDYISLLYPEITSTSISVAIILTSIGLLQLEAHKRKGVFSLVLASLRFKKRSLYPYSLWCCLSAWHYCWNSHWESIQMYFATEIQALLLIQPPVHQPSLQIIQKKAYSGNTKNKVYSVENAITSFYSILTTMESLSLPLSLSDISIPYINPSSIQLRYQENLEENSIERWAYLSDNRDYEEAFESLMDDLSKSTVNTSTIPQFYTDSGYSFSGTKSQSRVCVNQRIAVSFSIQNPLNEPLSIQSMQLQVSDKEANVEVSTDSMDLQPFETKTVTLFVTPKKPTTFIIKGVTFMISPSITITQALSLPKFRLNSTPSQRRRIEYGISQRMTVNVIPAHGVVACKMEGFRDTHFQSELIPLSFSIENRGDTPIQDVFFLTDNRDFYFAEDLVNNSPFFPSTPVFSLHHSSEPLSTLTLPCYYHNRGEDGLVSFRYVILIHSQDEWRMIRGEEKFMSVPLLSTSLSNLSSPESFYKCVLSNTSGCQDIDELTFFSSCPYCHLAPVYPAVLSPCVAGSTYACIMGVTAESTEVGEGTSRHVLTDNKYHHYCEFIEKYCAYEKRLKDMNRGEFAQRKHQFIDVVWWLMNEEEQECVGYCMKCIDLVVCFITNSFGIRRH